MFESFFIKVLSNMLKSLFKDLSRDLVPLALLSCNKEILVFLFRLVIAFLRKLNYNYSIKNIIVKAKRNNIHLPIKFTTKKNIN